MGTVLLPMSTLNFFFYLITILSFHQNGHVFVPLSFSSQIRIQLIEKKKFLKPTWNDRRESAMTLSGQVTVKAATVGKKKKRREVGYYWVWRRK